MRARAAFAAWMVAIACAGTGAGAGCGHGGGGSGDDDGDGDGDGGGGGDEGDGGEVDDGGMSPDAAPPLSTPPSLLIDADAFYPRALQLADGTILASVVSPQPSGRLGGTIVESTDGGVTFTIVGRIDDARAAGGLCCAGFYELPGPVGDLPAGTLLWSASVGGDTPAAPMSVPIWQSRDRGRTWTYLSTAATAGRPRSQGGLWEPEFSRLDDGTLVCHFSDETDPAHSQKLVAVRTADGITWNQRRDTVALAASGGRPGMAVVRRPPAGEFVMSYETCGVDGCTAHLRRSADGWDWGNPQDLGARPAALDGAHFRHAPTLAWVGAPGSGRFLLVGQQVFVGTTETASSGGIILANTEGGHAPWYPIPAPVPVLDAYDNFCPNYSSSLLPLDGGMAILELASRWDGNRCRTYFARGPLRGHGDATGVTSGTTYVLRSLQSGHCLDVANGSAAPGTDVRQWTCNGAPAQQWRVEGTTLRNPGSGLCLSVTAGGDVVQDVCGGATTAWTIREVGIGHYALEHTGTGACLDVAGGSTAVGANVARWTCNDLAPQIWRFD
jgi:hypothetical protein